MISVIVPVYNAELYVRRCVDSILAQTYTNFELLLIDDGSVDGSGKICDEYVAEDNRVRAFHKQNGGVSSARNFGLDNARGEYITFCDADDYVGKDWLSAFNKAISNYVDIAFQGYNLIRDTGVDKRIPSSFVGCNNKELQSGILNLFQNKCYGYICTPAFKKSLIDNNNLRFDESSFLNEDVQFLSKFLESVISFEIISEANYYYYCPNVGKSYKGDIYHSALFTCRSFYVVFKGDIPDIICLRYFPYVRDGAIDYIITGKTLDEFHKYIYIYMAQKLDKNRRIKDKIRNILILREWKLKVIPILGLKAIRMFTR